VIHHRKRSKIRNTITSARLRLQNWFGEILPPQIAAALSIDPRFNPRTIFWLSDLYPQYPYDAEPSPSATIKMKKQQVAD